MRSILLVSLLLFFIINVSGTCNDDQVLDASTDAYQYSPNSNPFEGFYKEWWFFTVHDEINNFGFCMGYSVSQPGNKNDVSGIAGMFWPNFRNEPNNINILQDKYPYSNFSASSQNATVSIGENNNIRVLNETTYYIEGATLDGILKWSLYYTQAVPACREKMQGGFVELDWMSYMPNAHVTGYFIFEDNKIAVDAKGYHDHNWGVWPTSDFNWVWAQYGDAEQEFALVMGAYNVIGTGEYVGYVFVRLNGEKYKIGTLCLDSYSLVAEKFEEWQGHKYSVYNKVEVKGSDWWLNMNYSTLSSGVNPGGTGLNLLVFEQISQFNVSLSKSDGKGGWISAVESSGLGFNEWSDIIKII